MQTEQVYEDQQLIKTASKRKHLITSNKKKNKNKKIKIAILDFYTIK